MSLRVRHHVSCALGLSFDNRSDVCCRAVGSPLSCTNWGRLMGRDLATRFGRDKPRALIGGVEALLVEYQHVDPTGRLEGWNPSILLVNASEDLATRSAFGALRVAFTSARCTAWTFPGFEGVPRLRAALAGLSLDSMDAIIFAADVPQTAPTPELQALVSVMPESIRGLVVVVGQDKYVAPVSGVTGFVRGVPVTTYGTAVGIFHLVAALSAPSTLTCLDHDDVASSLGAFDRPSTVIEGIWLRRSSELMLESQECSGAIGHAQRISCHIVGAELQSYETAAIMNAIRAKCRRDVYIDYQAPTLDLFPPYAHSGVVFITMICGGAETFDGWEVAGVPEAIDLLVRRFPRLFRGKRPRTHCDVPETWFAIVQRLFETINSMLSDDEAATFQITQIKKKLGTLRVYWSLGGGTDEFDSARGLCSTTLFELIDAQVRSAERACALVAEGDARR